MAPSKTSLTVAACAALASSSNAFMMPSRSSVSMTADKPSKAPAKASAAAVLAAGALLQGAVCTAPVDAAMFDAAPASELQVNVGIFGSKDAKEAAKPDSSKYDIQNAGSFAQKNSQGGVDYGSPKGTDFGKLAGGTPGVANEKKGTNFNANDNSNKSSSQKGSNPADVAQQKARKLAQKGEDVASKVGSSINLSAVLRDDKAGIGESVELGKQSPSLGGGSNWGNNDVVGDATGKAKDITTRGDLKDALKQGAKTWSGKGNPFSTPAEVATKPFGDVKKEQGTMKESTERESRRDTLSRATASVKDTVKDVNQGKGDQYKGINPEQ